MTKLNGEIEQLAKDNVTLRMNDLDAVIAMATDGDPEAIKSLMGLYVYNVEKKRTPPPELLAWAASVFLKYMSIDATDYTKFAHPGKRGRRKLNSLDRKERLQINNYIRENSSPDKHGSVTRAIESELAKDGCEGAMEKYDISSRTAFEILRQYSGDVKL